MYNLAVRTTTNVADRKLEQLPTLYPVETFLVKCIGE